MQAENNGASAQSLKRREGILEAAARVLVRVGFEKITTRLIAAEANVNVATLHYHFGNKEALLAEAVSYTLYRTEGILRRAVEAAPTLDDALEAGIKTLQTVSKERPPLLRYDLMLRALRDENARLHVCAVQAAYRKLVVEVVERHVDGGGQLPTGVTPEQIGRYIVAAVDGILLDQLVTGDDTAAAASLALVQRCSLAFLGLGADGGGGVAEAG